ncbi:hypothetical protein [Bombella favorum]|uniref:Uncharacterized protein n=1 Tax=Bombella favorum TaxID=2039164 RepID=A0ABR5ZKX9_9PROT|nr:hypothetical protein [Bombella favorum]MBA5724883.1 hypothetical protein [Bombella favorum]
MKVATGHIGRKCERAVITAYQELHDMGQSEMSIFAACTTLYRIHHPESSLPEARLLVSEWIDHHIVRRSSDPTRGCNCPPINPR